LWSFECLQARQTGVSSAQASSILKPKKSPCKFDCFDPVYKTVGVDRSQEQVVGERESVCVLWCPNKAGAHLPLIHTPSLALPNVIAIESV
jgi:hypothetical protein